MQTLFFSLALLVLTCPIALAQNCSERDYRGLKVEALPPMLGEITCQLKLLLKNRNSHDSLKQFVALHEELVGLGPKDVNWDQPLVPIINDLINNALEKNSLNKLAQGATKFYVYGGRYNLDPEEKALLEMLVKLDIQHGGRR